MQRLVFTSSVIALMSTTLIAQQSSSPGNQWSALFDTSIKVLGLLGAAFAWVYQTRAAGLRSKIRIDLEILEKTRAQFGRDDPRSKRVEAKVTTLMSYLYRSESPAMTRRRLSLPDLAFGILCLGGSAAWIWYSSSKALDPVWQFGVAGILTFLAIGAFLNAFDAPLGRR